MIQNTEAKDNIVEEESLFTINMYYSLWLIQEQTDQYLNKQRLGGACRQKESMKQKGGVSESHEETQRETRLTSCVEKQNATWKSVAKKCGLFKM